MFFEFNHKTHNYIIDIKCEEIMFRKKSIVLSDTKGNSNKKAVLSLEENSQGVNGKLRLYNFSSELDGISSLGFYINQKVYKAGLTYKSHMLYEFFIALNEIPSKFSCAVINFKNAEAFPILYGSSEGNQDDVYASIISEISKDVSVENAQRTLDKYGVDFDEEEKQIVEKEIDKAMCGDETCQGCANCVYKKYFFENIDQAKTAEFVDNNEMTESLVSQNENAFENEKDLDNLVSEEDKQKNEDMSSNMEKPMFIDKLKPQIDKLFANNPLEDNLQKLIPSSKWVRVEYEDDGDYFVFGLLYDEDGNVKYVCYGVPAVFDEQPPQELAGYPMWLPLNKDNKQGFGYWLTYQDASTGEPIKAILD